MGLEISYMFPIVFICSLKSFTSLPCRCRYAYQIVLKTLELLRAMPSLVDVDVPNGGHFTVCGDVHGQVFMLNGCIT